MNLIRHLQGLSNHILHIICLQFLCAVNWLTQVTSSLKYTWRSSYKILKTLIISRPFFDPRDEKKNSKAYCTSTRHTQSYLRTSFVYYLKCRWSSSDKSYMTENVIVRPWYDPRGKNENSKSLLHICKTCLFICRVSIVYSWKCRCSSTDKL